MEKDHTVEEEQPHVEEDLVDTEKIITNREKETNKPLTKLKIGKTMIKLKDHSKEVEVVKMDNSMVHVVELNLIGEVQGTIISDVVVVVVVQVITLGKKQDHILKETIVMKKILKLWKWLKIKWKSSITGKNMRLKTSVWDL